MLIHVYNYKKNNCNILYKVDHFRKASHKSVAYFQRNNQQDGLCGRHLREHAVDWARQTYQGTVDEYRDQTHGFHHILSQQQKE